MKQSEFTAVWTCLVIGNIWMASGGYGWAALWLGLGLSVQIVHWIKK